MLRLCQPSKTRTMFSRPCCSLLAKLSKQSLVFASVCQVTQRNLTSSRCLLHNQDNLGHGETWRKSRGIGFPLIDTVGFDDPENETDVQTMFMARYGPVDGSQRRNILSMKAWICNLHIRTVRIGSTGREQHG